MYGLNNCYVAYGPAGCGKTFALDTLAASMPAEVKKEFSSFVFLRIVRARYERHRMTFLIFKTTDEAEQISLYLFFKHFFNDFETFQLEIMSLRQYECFKIQDEDATITKWQVPGPTSVA